MSQSIANIVVHLVFSMKGRRQLLRDEERGQVHAYITGILKNLDSPLIEINSVHGQTRGHHQSQTVAKSAQLPHW